MKGYKLEGILTNTHWMSPSFVLLDKQGNITSISDKPQQKSTYEYINGYAIPGITNAHSHAFQYAMAGLTERHQFSNYADDFWSWRDKMYQIALSINPDQLEDIATYLYAEMLRNGYTHVCEFHYLHHDQNGSTYDNKAELGGRLINAADKAGIKITLIPIFYQQGGFGIKPSEEQRRFISKDIDTYEALWQASEKVCMTYQHASIAKGIHSLRAVEPELISKYVSELKGDHEVHMHIAEQLKEIEGSINYLGCRPVEWALNNLELNGDFHFVHATHMTTNETSDLAKTGANVVLCPSTEGNLGDGFFNLKEFQIAGGRWSIGTDSHVGLNPMEELRLLDYGQRLQSHKRNTFHDEVVEDSGLYAFNQIIPNVRKSAGICNKDFFNCDMAFDALIIDANHPLFATTSKDNLTNTIVYAADPSVYLGTMVNGKWKIKNGRHIRASSINNNFTKSLNSLNIR